MPGEPEGTPPQTPPQADPPKEPPKTDPTKTFTQADLDNVVQERLARERKQFADYDDLKARAAKFDELENSKKDELTKAQEAVAAAERRATEAQANANSTLKRAAIMSAAAKHNAEDAGIIIQLLANSEEVKLDETGNIVGADEAVKKLLTEKPFLAKASGRASGGSFGGNSESSLKQRIEEAEAKGDFKTALELKVSQGMGTAS